jgi:hypothetical protein
MKTLGLIFALALTLPAMLSAQSAGDYYFLKWNGSGFTDSYLTPGTSKLIAINGSGAIEVIAKTTYETPLEFGSGLTRAINAVTVNSAQNLTQLTNLTTNGLVKTTGGNGTLGVGVAGTDYLSPAAIGVTVQGYSAATSLLGSSIDLTSEVTGTLPVANGGTGITAFGTGVATALGQNISGSGGIVLGTSPSITSATLTTPSISGTITLPDNVRQTFNPGTNAAGLNVGSLAGDPDTLSNGDLWYDSTANELTARINGASVALGSGGGGGGNITIGSTTIAPGGSSSSLAALTTLSQTDLHTLTSTSNTTDSVNRILLENLQTAVANTEGGLADDQQRTPSIKFKANVWNGSASVAKTAEIWGRAASSGMQLNIGNGGTAFLSLSETAMSFGVNASSASFSLGQGSSSNSFSIGTNTSHDLAYICGQTMRLNLSNNDIEFNNGGTGAATFSGAATVSGAATFNGSATFNQGLTTGTGDDITGQGAMTTNSASEGIGYATGAGGTVTQLTNRSTGVTINKTTGLITCNSTSLAAAAEASFVVTNSSVAATDTVIVNVVSSATGTPVAFVTAVAAGSFTITLSNLHASTADTTADTIRFTVIKSVSN